jgi:hypothetical protein
MKRVLVMLAVLAIVFSISTAATAKTWTVYDPVWAADPVTVTLTGLGPDGHDAWWRGNFPQPPDDWAQAKFTFNFADMDSAGSFAIEYWIPVTPQEYSAGWGPITFANGAKWAAAPMDSRAGAWAAVGDLGFGTTIQKGDTLFFKWNPWSGYSNVCSAVRVTGPAIPEPSSLLALLAGFPALALLRRKR